MDPKPKSDKKKVVSKKETLAKFKEAKPNKESKSTPVLVSEKNANSLIPIQRFQMV